MSSQLTERSVFDVPLVVVDTETTGLYPETGHRVVELAAVRLDPDPSDGWQVTNEFSQLINPGRSMDPEASRINSIYDRDLVGKPSFEDVSDEIRSMVEGAVLVAHNAQFDASFLGMELYIESVYNPTVLYQRIPNPWLCTLMLARRNFHFGSNSLGQIARTLRVRSGRAHRALGDVYTTTEVLKRMTKTMADRGIDLVGDLLYAQGGAIYTPLRSEVDLPNPLDIALSDGERLKIVYDGPAGRTVRKVNPQYATEFQGKQYLITYCDQSRDQRTFRVDRILKAELI